MRLRALVVLPHRRVAALIEDHLGKFGVRHGVDLTAPALELASNWVSERRALPVSSSVSTISRAAWYIEMPRDRASSRTRFDRRVANRALRRVDDALELQVVRGVERYFEIGDGVA